MERKEPKDFLHRMPADFRRAIHSATALRAAWESITPLARNEWICWVTSAKKAETRKQRIERAGRELAQGKKRPCCWPGCPHRRPSAQKWFETRGKTASAPQRPKSRLKK